MIGEVTIRSMPEAINNLAETKEIKSLNIESFKNILPENSTTVKSAEAFWKQEFSEEAEKSKAIENSDNNTEFNSRIETNKDVEKLQDEYIKKAEETPDLNDLDPQGKGNYAEMKVDRDLASKGYERISKECVTDLSTPTGPGIDGVFVKKETGEILITETKFNKSELGNTLDGKQMSESWIDKRLDSAVGKEKADQIRMDSILNPNSVQSVLARVDLNGEVSYFKLDSAGNKTGEIAL